MNTISRSEFNRLPINEALGITPVLLTLDGEVKFIAAKPEDIIYVKDLHPRVRNMLKAMEAKARIGMPKAARKLDYEQVMQESKQVS